MSIKLCFLSISSKEPKRFFCLKKENVIKNGAELIVAVPPSEHCENCPYGPGCESINESGPKFDFKNWRAGPERQKIFLSISPLKGGLSKTTLF